MRQRFGRIRRDVLHYLPGVRSTGLLDLWHPGARLQELRRRHVGPGAGHASRGGARVQWLAGSTSRDVLGARGSLDVVQEVARLGVRSVSMSGGRRSLVV